MCAKTHHRTPLHHTHCKCRYSRNNDVTHVNKTPARAGETKRNECEEQRKPTAKQKAKQLISITWRSERDNQNKTDEQ